MDDGRLYSWGNPWFRWSVVSLVVLTVLSFLVGFVVLPSVQRDYTASGIWDSICRAAGLPTNWGARHRPPTRRASSPPVSFSRLRWRCRARAMPLGEARRSRSSSAACAMACKA